MMALNSNGKKVWSQTLDIFGRNTEKSTNFVPFRYQGQYYDEETGLSYNRFRYYDDSTGQYISQDPIRLQGGNPTLYGYVKDANSWIDIFGLHTQGGGSYDDWETITLRKGTVVYGGVPGQTGYYFPAETLNASNGSKQALWESLQVEPHKKLGFRSQVQAYILKEDITVQTSRALANPNFGKGGAKQFYIENYNDVLEKSAMPAMELH